MIFFLSRKMIKIYFEGFGEELIKKYNYVKSPEKSDYILIKLNSPSGRFEAKYEMQKNAWRWTHLTLQVI
jgi:hypothetical protein